MFKETIARYAYSILTTALCLFIPAGTFKYWQAWIYLPMLFLPLLFINLYLLAKRPDQLERRLLIKEKTAGQGLLSILFYTTLCAIFAVSGLDKRFHWSSVPLGIVIISQLLFLAGYLLLFLVYKENRYLAHTVKVEKEQELVTTGPYSIVRHPMYLSEQIMFIFAPIALGSYVAVAVNIPLFALLVARIIGEEKVLLLQLAGYGDYTRKTKYRLAPGIW